jgi:hypothetical protein
MLESTAQLVVVNPENQIDEEIEVIDVPLMETQQEPAVSVDIYINDIPGAPPGTTPPVPTPIEVIDEPKKDSDENDVRKPKKNEKWDWESKGAAGFIDWVKDKINTVPKHSGYDSAGIERAIAYLERLDNEISKAMRLDIDEELDASKIEHVRSQIEHGIELLDTRLSTVRDTKKKKKTKKADEEIDMIKLASEIKEDDMFWFQRFCWSNDSIESFVKEGFVKEASTPIVNGITATVPLILLRIARVCINSTVSNGRDIEDTFKKQAEIYKLNLRERAELMELIADMGYYMRQDRGISPDDETDITVTDNPEWGQQFSG